jgi:hypothetical protein
MVRKPVANRIYTSGVSVLHLNSLIHNNHDFFECKWSSIRAPSTTDFKREFYLIKLVSRVCQLEILQIRNTTLLQLLILVCRHGRTTSSSGSIQPFIDQLKTGELRECNFIIVVPSDQQILFSCSVLNMTSSGSYLQVKTKFSIQNLYH